MAAEPRPVSRGPVAVVAAGGILTRGGLAPRIAIVHRPKYDDWSLPKGKLEHGESCEQAALREVQEETGCRAKLRRLAGLTQYPVAKGLKLVLFWHMDLEAEATCELGADVDEVLWVSPAEAVSRLSHSVERELVQRECIGWLARWWRWFGWPMVLL